MKQVLLKSMMICLLFGSWSMIKAQDPSEGVTEMGDTLVIKATFNGELVNALNEWILWDHDGDLANTPNHSVYKLLRNAKYPISTTVIVNGRTHLVADKPDLDNKPPHVGVIDGLTGSAAPGVMFAGGPYTWRNLWLTHLNYATKTNNAWGLMSKLEVDNTSNYIDGCYFEFVRAIAMKATSGVNNRIYFTNNFFNDCGNGATTIWHGHFFNTEERTQDSIVFRNNTMINSPGILINARKNMNYYIEISNNTMINTCAYPFFTTFWIEGVVKNNLMLNVLSRGETLEDQLIQEPDGLAFSMINIDTLAGEFPLTDPTWYDKEAERKLEVNNNYYGWVDELETFYASDEDIIAPTWMNTRTVAMFADDTNYPLLSEENNWTKADLGIPEFVTPIVGTDALVSYVKDVLWAETPVAGYRYVWEPDGADVPNLDIDWPPLEDLRIKSAGFVGDDGNPIGDLNWYPEHAQRWDMTGWGRDDDATSISKHTIIGSGIEIGNFPNPFEHETNFSISLKKAEDINVSVYDNLGRNIATLYNGKKVAGQHLILWNGMSNSGGDVPSGIYFLRVNTNSEAITHKLMKL